MPEEAYDDPKIGAWRYGRWSSHADNWLQNSDCGEVWACLSWREKSKELVTMGEGIAVPEHRVCRNSIANGAFCVLNIFRLISN